MDKFIMPKYARTQITWKIQNITQEMMSRSSFPKIESPSFSIYLKDGQYNSAKTQWKLYAHRHRSALIVFLVTDSANGTYKNYSNLHIKYEFKLKECYTHNHYIHKTKGEIKYMYFEHRLGKAISVADFSKRNSYRYIQNNAIEIVVCLDMIEKSTASTTDLLNKSELSSNYENLYNNEKYSDYLLITADNEEIPVHKNILATRSNVFERMMETALKEGEEKKAKIDDIDSRALKELVRFMYCGRVQEIDPIATDLIYAAEKYDLMDLKPLCVESLVKQLSLKNAIETLMLADLHKENALKTYTKDFILFNYEELKDDESWKKISLVLLKDILDTSASRDRTNSQITLSSSIIIKTSLNTAPLRTAAQPAAQPFMVRPPAVQPVPAAVAARNEQNVANRGVAAANAAQPAVARNP